MSKATKFYDECALRAARNGHAVDVFSCALDQTGLMEMKRLCKETGGHMILCEGFEHEVFKKSLVKMFDKDDKGHLKVRRKIGFFSKPPELFSVFRKKFKMAVSFTFLTQTHHYIYIYIYIGSFACELKSLIAIQFFWFFFEDRKLFFFDGSLTLN